MMLGRRAKSPLTLSNVRLRLPTFVSDSRSASFSSEGACNFAEDFDEEPYNIRSLLTGTYTLTPIDKFQSVFELATF
jgi:hypothetical protein